MFVVRQPHNGMSGRGVGVKGEAVRGGARRRRMLLVFHVPDLHKRIFADGNDMLAVGGPGYTAHPFVMAAKGGDEMSSGDFPDLHRLIFAGRDDALAAGGPRQSAHPAFMAVKGGDLLSIRSVPDLNLLQRAGG